MTLTTNKYARIATLCILYFAQGLPWGFMTTALISYLASKGLTMAESGILIAKANLPWTFKLFWGPIIDSFTYQKMGKRRPWIIIAQLGMAISLISFITIENISDNIQLLGWMFFIHNCFASLQDVSSDALAVDILKPNEQGQVNGGMMASKVIGVGAGTVIMGTLLTKVGLVFAVSFQIILILMTMIIPIIFIEKPGDKYFPWSGQNKKNIIKQDNINSPISIIKSLIISFSNRASFSLAVFILVGYINMGINSGILPVYYSQDFGWDPEKYSQIIGGPGTVIQLLAALLGGYLVDKIGRRKIMILGYGGFSLCCSVFGVIILNLNSIPQVVQIGWLLIGPALISMGHVAVYSLGMALSWGKASATMFTTYMAIANLSVVIGSSFIDSLTSNLSIPHIYICLGVMGIMPLYILKFSDPKSRLILKGLEE